MKALARRDQMEMQTLDGEIVVRDTRNGAEHALQPLAVRVWEMADGSRDAHAMHAALRTERSFADATLDEVWSALDALGDAELLEQRVTPPLATPISRRSAVLRLAAGAAAIGTALGATLSLAGPRDALAQPPKGRVAEQQQKRSAEQQQKRVAEQRAKQRP